jgi:LysR family transcriptional regulator, low CO2-responsive transcriptional regulator
VMRDWYVIHMRDKRLSPIATAFRAFLLERGAGSIDRTIGGAADAAVRRARS